MQTPQAALDRYGYNAIARHVFTGVATSVALFLAAGTLNWSWGWLYSIVHVLAWLALSLVLARTNPALLNKRGRPARDMTGTKRWDWFILIAYTALMFIVPIVAGLDYGNGAAPDFHLIIRVIGLMLLCLGFGWLAWSMAANKFFEPTVRIQTDQQVVASDGPYRYLRHPGYFGVVLQFLAAPLALGSVYAFIPALLGIALFIVRVVLEDAALQRELPGYAEYAQRTRYRLLPFMW
jgi:protein-S-isoprenylcysteine O-methyltransferase Ste14